MKKLLFDRLSVRGAWTVAAVQSAMLLILSVLALSGGKPAPVAQANPPASIAAVSHF